MLLPSCFSCVWLCATPWTAAYQASPSMGFSRQEHWSGLPFQTHNSETLPSYYGSTLVHLGCKIMYRKDGGILQNYLKDKSWKTETNATPRGSEDRRTVSEPDATSSNPNRMSVGCCGHIPRAPTIPPHQWSSPSLSREFRSYLSASHI